MRAAVLTDHGAAPAAADFDTPEASSDDHVVVEVAAAGVNHLDLLKASGKFYTGPPPLPSVVGSDGVGRLPDGRRVFFDACVAPYGSMAEHALVEKSALFEMAEDVEDEVAAALGNTGLAAWLALEWRAELQAGETVLVLGAAGSVGSAAIQCAKLLGAALVVAVDRPGIDADRLKELGADEVLAIDDDRGLSTAIREATDGGPHVIIDPIWGAPALAAMEAAAHGARHIQIGQLGGVEISLPAPTVRAAALDIRGFAVFWAPPEVRQDAFMRLTGHAAKGDLAVAIKTLTLDEIPDAWALQGAGPPAKLVITPR